MGQQQILLIVLSVILVGIAISVGITMFRTYTETANQDSIILDIINISTVAYQHKFRPASMGGGSGSFKGFQLPGGFENNANAEYAVEIDEDNQIITITAESNSYPGATVSASFDLDLELVPQTDKSAGVNRNGYIFLGWN